MNESEHVVVGKGPCVVLIHGAGGSPEVDFPFIEELAATNLVIAPRLSLWRDRFDSGVDAVAEAVVELIDDNEASSLSIVGFSMGSTIATAVASRVGPRARYLMLAAGFMKPRPSLLLRLQIWETLLRSGEPGAFLLAMGTSDSFLARLTQDDLASSCAEIDNGERPDEAVHIRFIRGVDVTSALIGVRCRVVVVVPTDDAMVDPQHSREISAVLPGARVVELQSGHELSVGAADDWLREITSILREASA